MSILHRTGAAALATLLAVAACDSPVAGPAEVVEPMFSQNAAEQQTAVVMWHAQQQLLAFGGNGKSGPVAGASARLVRNSNGIAYQIHAAELAPGNAYSLWLVVINNPAACAATPCSAADILVNPATDSQVRSGGTGSIAGAAGKGTMAGSARRGPLSGWLDGRSLQDPFSAEVHLVINDHGPMLPAFMPGMITTYRAGCSDASPFPGVFPATALADGAPGPNTCLLYQAAVFQAP
jgi:hypothetical protein